MAGAPHWSQVLEAIHSATIDALNLRFPDSHVVLGVPRKNAESMPPDPDCIDIHREGLEVPQLGTGVVILAASPELSNELRLNTSSLWGLVLQQAKATALPQRGLEPQFGSGTSQSPRQVIWIPMGLAQARIWLGIGVH